MLTQTFFLILAGAGLFSLGAQAAELSVQDLTTLVSRAQVESSNGNFEAAIRTLSQAKKLEVANSAAARSSFAQLHLQIGGELLKRKEFDLSLAQLLRARANGLHSVDILLVLATLENNLGAYGDALADANVVVSSGSATNAQRATAAAIGGLASKNQKEYDTAIPLLKLSVQLAPSEIAYLALAESYEMSDKAGEAVKLLTQAATTLPRSRRIQLAFGRSLVNAGDNKHAAEVLTALTQLAPDEAEAWHWRAQAESSLGNYRDAANSLQHMAQIQPGYPTIDAMVAQALLKLEPPNYQEALRVLDHAAQTTPSDPDVFYLRGRVYFLMGNYRDAIEPLQHSIALGPEISLTYYLLGRTLEKLGRNEEAKEQFERFRSLRAEVP